MPHEGQAPADQTGPERQGLGLRERLTWIATFKWLPWTRMNALASCHSAKPWERLLAGALAAPAVAAWGRRRGRRAARRVLFELSWRLAGERTYTSRGCPGRLFYAES